MSDENIVQTEETSPEVVQDVQAESSTAEGNTSEESESENYIPYARFKKVNDELKELRKSKTGASEGISSDYENLDLKGYAEKIREETLAEIKKEQEAKIEMEKQQEELVDSGMELISKEFKVKITPKVRDEVIDFASEYRFDISTPDDFLKIYKLYDANTKISTLGKARSAETLSSTNTPTASPAKKIDVTSVPWGSKARAIAQELG